MANPLDRSSGSPIDATDLVARITVNSDEVIEVGSVSVGGLSAQVFDISGGSGYINVKWHPDSNPTQGLGWFLPPRARPWLVDHPDRGLLMIAAETWEEGDESSPPIVATAEEMLASLEFIELG